MAAKENQTTQMFLIISAFIIIVLAGFCYWFYKSGVEADLRADKLQSQLRDKSTATSTLQQENENYRTNMGFGKFDTLETVDKQFKDDMLNHGSSYPEEQRNYRTLLENASRENETISLRESGAIEEKRLLNEKLKAVESEKETQISRYLVQMEQLKKDLGSEQNQFAQDRQQLEATKQQLMTNLDQQRQELEEQITNRDKKIGVISTKLAKSERTTKILLEKLKRQVDSFEVADGKITWVNQSGTVWVNIGKSDALRRQVVFSVYDANLDDAASATKKGSIEITRILSDNTAEATITLDDPTNPILTGDKIYSPVWHAGKQLRFAMTGILDIDGDGRNDIDRVRELVKLNGAIVDAYQDNSGMVNGKISVNTRYLILGTLPSDSGKPAIRKGWNVMGEEASLNGVETIHLDEFLDQVGYRPRERTVQFGRGATSKDYAEKVTTQPRSIGTTTELFRKRAPYRGPAATPY